MPAHELLEGEHCSLHRDLWIRTEPATHLIAEGETGAFEIERFGLVSALCCRCFGKVMGQVAKDNCERAQEVPSVKR